MMKTTAAVLTQHHRPLDIRDLAIPDLAAGQVLVEISWAGVCHSQLNEIKGRRGPDPYLPHTLGHEGSGVVVAVGADVTKVEPEDRVVLTWIKGSGANVPNCTYDSADGSVNSGPVSTFMTHAVVSENRVVRLPDGIRLRDGALLGCAVPTGLGLVRNEANVRPGQTVAIFGVGGIGQVSVIGAALQEAKTIVAIDRVQLKLEHALRLGATDTVNACETDFMATLADMTGDEGFDVAIEATGDPIAMEAAYACTRPGGITVLAGNPAFGSTISIDPMRLIHGQRLIGSSGGASEIDSDLPRFAELQASRRLELSKLISHEFALPRINEAFAALEAGETSRAVIRISESASD